uniref:Uncharacterized protein n=1 Tax=Amphiprion ocellaris TaxID=80972 RepID=A0A3Q1D8X4_AMPOC
SGFALPLATVFSSRHSKFQVSSPEYPGFIIKPAAFPHITRVREGIRFQNKPVSSILKTCSGLYPPSSVIALNFQGVTKGVV